NADARQLEQRLRELDEECEWLQHEQRRVDQALQLDWTEAFARSTRDIDAEVERAARDHGAKLLRTLGASIDTWFLSSQSLEWLVQGQWSPLVRDYREAVFETGRKAFDAAGAQMDAGFDLPDGVSELTRRAGIDLRQLRAHAYDAVGRVEWPKHSAVPVDVRKIPVKKGVVDRLAFRSLDKVRQRLFGAFDKPDAKIPGRDKARHLGEAGRLHLHQCVAQFRSELLPQTTQSLSQHFGERFIAQATQQLVEQLSGYAPRIAQKLEQLESERKYLMGVATPLRDLGELTSGTRTKLQALGAQFVREATLVPQAKDVVLEPKAPQPQTSAEQGKGRKAGKRGARTPRG
ncbi:MAG: hypothetical protein KAI24_01560, partial [Planctomycetes bacterium]|nr:hypothetical protein [Planctomycetota bacterium]